MPTGFYRGFDERDYMLQGRPTATMDENFPHDQITGDLAGALQDGVMTTVACPLIEGDEISSVSFIVGATALATPSHFWVALYGPDGKVLGHSADQTAPVMAADGVITATLTVPVRIASSDVYFVGIMVAAVTPPTLMGKTRSRVGGLTAADTAFGFPTLAQNSGSGLTTTAPATIATPSDQVDIPYVCLR